MRFSIYVIFVVVAFLISAPTTIAHDAGAVAPSVSQHDGDNEVQSSHGLTLEQAIAAALRQNPILAASTHGLSAAQARLDQAGLYPNPEFDLQAENFGGGGELAGFDLAETTFAFSQPILLGGKVAGRKGVASSDLALAATDLNAARLDVVAQTTIAFDNVITNQEKVRLVEELLVLAESFGDTVRTRVEAGKVSPVDLVRAQAAVARTRVEVAKATRELAAARIRLAATWGSSDPDFSQAIGALLGPTTLPPRASLRRMLSGTPEMVRLAEEVQRQEHVIKIENSRGVPDLTVSAGPRHYSETGEWAWVGGISIPLPIFDRNQGARRAAEFELERTRSVVAAQRTALESALGQRLERLHAVSGEARSYEEEIVPASTEAFEAISVGFREGKFGFLEVLDAQRSLFDARLLHLDSLQRYATAHARLERLIGHRLGGEDHGESGPPADFRGDEK